ncbi:MAG: EamA family transporter, partial [Chloroflexota bacterium]
MTDTTATTEQAAASLVPGIFISLLAHASWGMYPVLARYLQTVSDLPTLSILAAGNIIPLVILSRYLFGHLDLSVFRQRIIWIFAAIVVFRAITNIASARFTLSIYVQLITQATPFVVILISTVIFREQLPRFTIPAVTVALVGSVMMIGPNFGNIPDDPTRRDWLGITLAMMSVISLGTYMVLVKRSMHSDVSSETLLMVQLIAIIVVGGIASFALGEDWGSYLRMGWMDWGVFLLFAFLVFIGAN